MAEHLSDMIVDKLVDEILAFNTTIAASGEKFSVVKGGKLQASPLKLPIHVLLHIGDPDDPKWEDSTVALRNAGATLDRYYMDVSAYQIGAVGGSWWRRFTLEFGLFFVKSKEDRDEARRIANLTRGRLEKLLITSTGVPRLTDSLGEIAMLILPVTSVATEGGGPPNQFIWRGQIRFQVLTVREFS